MISLIALGALIASFALAAGASQATPSSTSKARKAARVAPGSVKYGKDYMYSYKQFKALSRSQQYRYIRGLSKVFTKLSSKIKKSKKNKKKYSALLEAIQNFVGSHAQASAAYKCIGGGVPVPYGEPECGVTEYAGFSCPQVDSRGRPARMEICNPILFGVRSDTGNPVCHSTASTSWCFNNTRIGVTTTLDPVFERNQAEPWNSMRWELHVACNTPSSIAERQSLVNNACYLAERQMNHNDDDDRRFLTNSGRSYEAVEPSEFSASAGVDEASITSAETAVVSRNNFDHLSPFAAATNGEAVSPELLQQAAVLAEGDAQGAVAEGAEDRGEAPMVIFSTRGELADNGPDRVAPVDLPMTVDPTLAVTAAEFAEAAAVDEVVPVTTNLDPNLIATNTELGFSGTGDVDASLFAAMAPGDYPIGRTEEEIAADEARAEMLRNAQPVIDPGPLTYSAAAPELPPEEDMSPFERQYFAFEAARAVSTQELRFGTIVIPPQVSGTSHGLNYRDAPGTNNTTVLGSFEEGQQVELTGNTQMVGETLWHEVRVDGRDDPAWVSGNFIQEGREVDLSAPPERETSYLTASFQSQLSAEGGYMTACHECDREPSFVSANGLIQLYGALNTAVDSRIPVRPSQYGAPTCAISSGQGPRSLSFSRHHEGIDIRTGGRGVAVDSPLPGIVIGHGRRGGYGGQIIVLHVPEHMHERITAELRDARVLNEGISLKTRQTRLRNYLASRQPALSMEINNGSDTVRRQNLFCMYSHLRNSGFDHDNGDSVAAGDRIGYVATSGRDMGATTGAHLDMRCEAPGEDACTYAGDIGGQGPWCDPEDFLPWIPRKSNGRYYKC
ncbi:MAG: hypothetical protein HRT45_12840 [Bdellovibrionales bacterium]|nr:hypothetical protein [Bdellovibrionales bacterium]